MTQYNPNLYYRASEARKVLGNISANELKLYVDRGKLKKYPPPGKIQPRYRKAEVDALAEEIRRFNAGEQEGESHGRRQTAQNSRRGRAATR